MLDPWHLLRHHGEALAQAASDILDLLPEAQLVAVIVTPDAVFGDALRVLLREFHGDPEPDRVCLGLLPRDRVANLLDGALPHCRTALATHSVPQQLLPIVVATPNGARTGSVPCSSRAAG